MNLVTKEIAAILLLSSFGLLYAQDGNANLTIQTNADSSGLFIDDNFIGVGNKFQIESKSGIHLIQIVQDLRIWNSEIIKDTINIKNSDELVLDYNFKSQKLINSIPQNARVYENDSLVGFTPILLGTTFNELKLEKLNYSSVIVTTEEISVGKIPELKFTGEQPKKQFYGSTMFYTLLGTAIALGGTTAYYKLKADDLYEEYKITGDPGLPDNIEHYDDQSAWTLIATELCIGAIIYFFLTD
jgi:hypothetical protein